MENSTLVTKFLSSKDTDDEYLMHSTSNSIELIITLLSEIFAGRKFRGSKKPRNFCLFAEENFAVHVLEQISREFNFAVEWKFRFSILIKNNFIK